MFIPITIYNGYQSGILFRENINKEWLVIRVSKSALVRKAYQTSHLQLIERIVSINYDNVVILSNIIKQELILSNDISIILINNAMIN